MKYLLDTNACVRHLRSRGTSTLSQRLLQEREIDIALCSVVRAELLYGALRSANATQNRSEVDRFTSRFTSLPFDDSAADRLADVQNTLARAGTLIGPYDLMIAAIALANDLTLVTHNTAEFARVRGLRLEDWETP